MKKHGYSIQIMQVIVGLVLYMSLVNWAFAQESKPYVTLISPPTVKYAYTPSTLYVGEKVKLEWSSTNATRCIDHLGHDVEPNGSWSAIQKKVGEFSGSIRCTSLGGTTTSKSSFQVKPIPAPRLQYAYTPSTLHVGDRVLLTWSSANATECINNYGFNIGLNGSWDPIRYESGEFTTSLTCSGAGGSVSKSSTYTVLPNRPQVNWLRDLTESEGVDQWIDNLRCNIHPITFAEINEADKEPDVTYECDVRHMYNASQGIDGVLDLFLATGDYKYLELSLSLAEKYILQGKDKNGDDYLDWYSSYQHEANSSQAYLDYDFEWRAAQAIARTAAIAINHTTDNGYQTRATDIVNFLEHNVWQKWSANGIENRLENITVTHWIGRAGLIAHNLYLATGNNLYKTIVETNAIALKNSLESINTLGGIAYNIPCYIDGGSCATELSPIEGTIDVSHSGDTVSFMIETYLDGGYDNSFTYEDMIKLVNTVKYLVISDVDNKFRSNVCTACMPVEQIYPLIDPFYENRGAYQGSWAKLARFDGDLRAIYSEWIGAVTEQQPSVSISQDLIGAPGFYARIHIYGNLALAIYWAE